MESLGTLDVRVAEPFAVAAAPAERGTQEGGPVLCALEGRIFNLPSIAERLGLGPDTTPERTLAVGWERHGAELLPSLKGSFALVFWDRERRQGALVRDPLGSIPLFWTGDGRRFGFASEIRPLLDLLRRTPEADRIVLAHWLSRRRPPADMTPFAGLSRLPAGHMLRFDLDGYRASRWWTPAFQPPPQRDEAEAAQELRDQMTAALDRATAGASRLGIRLSGGFDSGCVAALSAGNRTATLRTYSVVFPDHPLADESARIADLRTRLRLDGLERPFRGGSALAAATEFIAAWRVPPSSPNGFVWRPLFRQAASDGVEVMLDGNGGDEVFGCSPYLLADQLRRGRLIALTRSVRRLPGMGPAPSASRVRRGLAEYALRGNLPPRAHALARRLRNRSGEERPWLQAHVAETVREFEDPYGWKRLDGPRWWAALVNSLVLIPDSLVGADELRREAALNGLSFAHPWRDPELVAHVLAQPPELSFDPCRDRPLAREAMAGVLPDSVRLSEEKPFFNPVLDDSLGSDDAETVEELLSNPPDELAANLRRDEVRSLLERRAEGSIALDVWRLATAALWLRSLRDPSAIGASSR